MKLNIKNIIHEIKYLPYKYQYPTDPDFYLNLVEIIKILIEFILSIITL